MGTLKISDTLKQAGFFMALGTTEMPGFSPSPVKLGTPSTWGQNNGVVAVYDEAGNPWIIRAKEVTPEVRRAVFSYELGGNGCAYVPHSNDGGNFVRNDMPALLATQTPVRPELVQPMEPDFYIEVNHGLYLHQMMAASGCADLGTLPYGKCMPSDPIEYKLLEGGRERVGVKLMPYGTKMHPTDVARDFAMKGLDCPLIADFLAFAEQQPKEQLSSDILGLVKDRYGNPTMRVLTKRDVEKTEKAAWPRETWWQKWQFKPGDWHWVNRTHKDCRMVGNTGYNQLYEGVRFMAIVSRKALNES